MRRTVLIVENDPMSRELSRRVLTAGGYRVTVAHDGEQALRVAPKLRPHLVLMDMRLPGIDGIETTKRLKRGRATASIPIAVLSAQAFADDIARARAAGAVEYLTKPIGARELLDRVDALLCGSEERPPSPAGTPVVTRAGDRRVKG